VESTGSGMVAGINMAKLVRGQSLIEFPKNTALGAQAYYLANTEPKYFQPMNVNHGIFPTLPDIHSKKDRKTQYATQSIDILKEMTEAGLFD
jgi:methylenetetrahydrofolate--tRNA-(uracil-5-)-methyltransferase